jgi:preprotein translocase subunit SecD
MKNLPDLLRDADPLAHEARRSARERRMNRQEVLDSPRGIVEFPRRRVLMTAIAATVVVGIVSGSRYWSRFVVDVVAAVRFEVHLAEENPAEGLREIAATGTGRRIYLHPETVVTNSDIARAQVVQGDSASAFSVSVTFNAGGAAKVSRATANHIGRPLAILLDGEVVMAPVLRSPITTTAIISGQFTRVEAERIVTGIIGR